MRYEKFFTTETHYIPGIMVSETLDYILSCEARVHTCIWDVRTYGSHQTGIGKVVVDGATL